MTPEHIHKILEAVAGGTLPVTEAMERLRALPMESIHGEEGIVARLDTHRALRHGFPEVILAQGKRFAHLEQVVERALGHDAPLLITRVAPRHARRLAARFPQLVRHRAARCLARPAQEGEGVGLVAVLCAGTSDVGVAEEAALTARLLGARVETHYDAGVAGLHRLLAARELLRRANVFVVAAGMEGALPSVVGGLVDKPVIAVPTSQGYGAALGGLTALMGMLNSCAANVTVVNIDNGFGAGYVAGLINRNSVS